MKILKTKNIVENEKIYENHFWIIYDDLTDYLLELTIDFGQQDSLSDRDRGSLDILKIIYNKVKKYKEFYQGLREL